jgi:hypothetical protein
MYDAYTITPDTPMITISGWTDNGESYPLGIFDCVEKYIEDFHSSTPRIEICLRNIEPKIYKELTTAKYRAYEVLVAQFAKDDTGEDTIVITKRLFDYIKCYLEIKTLDKPALWTIIFYNHKAE